MILLTPRLVDPADCKQMPKALPGSETRKPDDFEFYLETVLEAPRGQRLIWAGGEYIPAWKSGPSAAIYPCPGGNCGTGGPAGAPSVPVKVYGPDSRGAKGPVKMVAPPTAFPPRSPGPTRDFARSIPGERLARSAGTGDEDGSAAKEVIAVAAVNSGVRSAECGANNVFHSALRVPHSALATANRGLGLETEEMHRIAIVDPNEATRESLRTMLLGVDFVWLEAECARYEYFFDVIQQSTPDLVIVSLDGDKQRALGMVGQLAHDYAHLPIITVSMDQCGPVAIAATWRQALPDQPRDAGRSRRCPTPIAQR